MNSEYFPDKRVPNETAINDEMLAQVETIDFSRLNREADLEVRLINGRRRGGISDTTETNEFHTWDGTSDSDSIDVPLHFATYGEERELHRASDHEPAYNSSDDPMDEGLRYSDLDTELNNLSTGSNWMAKIEGPIAPGRRRVVRPFRLSELDGAVVRNMGLGPYARIGATVPREDREMLQEQGSVQPVGITLGFVDIQYS